MIIINNEPLEKINTAYYDWKVSEVPDLTLRVSRKNNEKSNNLLVSENIVKADGHFWRIINPTLSTTYISTKAVHTFLDLKTIAFLEIRNGLNNIQELFSTLLQGTNFTLDLDLNNLPENISLEDFGRNNKYDLFLQLIDILEAEYLLMPNNVVKVAKFISKDEMKQIRYGNNAKDVKVTTDSSDIVTSVTIFYGENYSLNETFVSSNESNYSKRYHIIISDERITSLETARQRATKEFSDLRISYDIDLISNSLVLQPGEMVWTVYEPLNDLKVKTRTISVRREWQGEYFISNEAKLGNFVFKTGSEVVAEQLQKNKDEIEGVNKKVLVNFEILDDRIRSTVNEIGIVQSELQQTANTLSLTVQQVNGNTGNITILGQRIDSVVSRADGQQTQINQTAEDLRLAVLETNGNSAQIEILRGSINSNVTRIAEVESNLDQTADSLRLAINRIDGAETSLGVLDGRITAVVQTANGNSGRLDILEDEIDLRVTKDGVISAINVSTEGVVIDANRISLNGAVLVDGSITGNGNLNISNDIYVGNNITLGEFRSGDKQITFSQSANIHNENTSELVVSASLFRVIDGDLSLGGDTSFVRTRGNWNFSEAVITGLRASSVQGYTFSHTSGSGGTNNLTVRYNGAYLGIAVLNP